MKTILHKQIGIERPLPGKFGLTPWWMAWGKARRRKPTGWKIGAAEPMENYGRNHGGADGGRSHGGEDGGSAHGGVDGGRMQGTDDWRDPRASQELAMVKVTLWWREKPRYLWARLTMGTQGNDEAQATFNRTRDLMILKDRKTKAESWWRVAKVQPRGRRTEVMPVSGRTLVKSEGWRRPMEQ